MNTVIRIIVCLAIFLAGYTLGQGHNLFDVNGDHAVNRSDLTALGDKLLMKHLTK